MRSITAFAPAKINLFLHVGALAADGYHPLSSWMVFADFGDEISVAPADAPSFTVTGPFADGVPRDGSNLVLKARDALRGEGACAITLTKRLPPASGIGGGSSDAAATLRALGELWSVPHSRLAEVAPDLGSDVPPCLEARSLIATGRGERLGPAPTLPNLHAVLVNPRIETATGKVFATYDADPVGGAEAPDLPNAFTSLHELVQFLATTRNDLEAPAKALHSQIGDVLAALAAAPESRFTRMSGSGATCFALCDNALEASALTWRLAQENPQWWVQSCCLITSP